MITTGRAAYQKECRYAEYAGLSTDNKLDPAIAPVLQNGDTFKEIDTGATFKYNAASGQWVEQPASGGGGGTPGPAGQNGATFTPSVSADGVLSWTNNGGLDNPDPVNIMGPQGPQGAQGSPGAQGAPGAAGANGQDGGYYQPSVATDGTLTWTASVSSMPSVASVNIRGPQGPAGADGAITADGGTFNAGATLTGEDEMTIEVPDTGESAVVGITPDSVELIHNTNSNADARLRVVSNGIELTAGDNTVQINGTGIDMGGSALTNVNSIGASSAGEIAIENNLEMNNHQILGLPTQAVVDATTDTVMAQLNALLAQLRAAGIIPSA